MTRTQTALAHWPTDNPEWFLIDPAEWQKGQEWKHSPMCSTPSPGPPTSPVWVRELLPIPDPPTTLPWHTFTPTGECIAWLTDLPDGTTYAYRTDSRPNDAHQPMGYREMVIVVEWPDGTKPARPAHRFTADHDGVTRVVVVDGGHTVDRFEFDDLEQAAAFVAQVNGDQA